MRFRTASGKTLRLRWSRIDERRPRYRREGCQPNHISTNASERGASRRHARDARTSCSGAIWQPGDSACPTRGSSCVRPHLSNSTRRRSTYISQGGGASPSPLDVLLLHGGGALWPPGAAPAPETPPYRGPTQREPATVARDSRLPSRAGQQPYAAAGHQRLPHTSHPSFLHVPGRLPLRSRHRRLGASMAARRP